MELVLKDDGTTISVSQDIFGCSFNQALIHQVVNAYIAGARQGTKAQKNRSEVAGSKKKPWRQKGTGRARAGSFKSPIWRSGGVTFAAKRRNYSQKVNKRMYKCALRSIFSELIRQNRLIIINNLFILEPKTQYLLNKLYSMNLMDSYLLIVLTEIERNLFLSARNLYKVELCKVADINPVSLIDSDKILVTADAVRKVEERLL